MGLPRLAFALALVVALSVGVVAVAAWERRGAVLESATFDVRIVGPANATMFDGNVRVDDATALTALQAACRQAGLALELETYAGMGVYVRAIGGHRASGASGWVYEVERAGTVVPGDRTAAAFALHKDDALRWRWVDA